MKEQQQVTQQMCGGDDLQFIAKGWKGLETLRQRSRLLFVGCRKLWRVGRDCEAEDSHERDHLERHRCSGNSSMRRKPSAARCCIKSFQSARPRCLKDYAVFPGATFRLTRRPRIEARSRWVRNIEEVEGSLIARGGIP